MPPKAASNRQTAPRRPPNVDTASPAPVPSDAGPEAPRPSASARATPALRGGPVQRLQTLKKRTSSGSLVPLNPDGTTPKPTLKFQPKAVVRRSKEEREARERLEATRLQERISDAAATRRTATPGGRGRGRGRGRGGTFGRALADAGGLPGPARGGKSGGRYSQFSAKRSGVYGLGGRETLSGDVSSDEESDYGPRFSIDDINKSSDSDQEMMDDEKGKAPAKVAPRASRGLRPIRVERQDHVERIVDINTDASSSKSAELRRQAKEKASKEDSLFVESDDEGTPGAVDVEMADTNATDLHIKEEPGDGQHGIAGDIPDERASSETLISSKLKKPTKRVSIDDERSLLQTEEERQEYDRHEHDIEQLKQALGNITTADPTIDVKAEDDIKAKNEAIKEERQGRLFLLQFPPMTPNLIKRSPNREIAETSVADSTSQSKASDATVIKEENGDTTSIPALPLITATSNQLPPGRVGKLQIHKSGRATIDWGGISFELNKGSDVDFLQDAVVASDSKPGDNPAVERKIWAMSQVSGKLVVTPDWDKLLD